MSRFYTIWRFLTHDIWTLGNEDVRGVYRWLMNTFKAVYLSVRFFMAHRIMERASALTYYSLLAIVPMVALTLGIGRGFGMQEVVRESLISNFPAQVEVVNYICDFADQYLKHATSSVILGVGIVLLLYVVYSLIGNVENVFNEIWQQKYGRSAVRKITDYLSIIIIVPLFLAVSSGMQIYLQAYIRTDVHDYVLSQALIQILRWTPYLLGVVMLTFIYVAIPNCKVKLRNAFIAALIAGAAFFAFQWVYISGMIWVSKYNAIYGSFAALPLLLLWIQTTWIICLYGAELAFASQNIQNYNFENLEKDLSRRDHDFMLVLVAAYIYNRFRYREMPTTAQITEALRLPTRFTGNLVRELVELGIINEYPTPGVDEPNGWQPGREPHTCTVAEVYDLVSTSGQNRLRIDYKRQFATEWKTLEAMHRAALSQGSERLLRDISFDTFKPQLNDKVKRIGTRGGNG